MHRARQAPAEHAYPGEQGGLHSGPDGGAVAAGGAAAGRPRAGHATVPARPGDATPAKELLYATARMTQRLARQSMVWTGGSTERIRA